MCIIVDANAAHDLATKTDHGIPVLKWLLNPKKKAGLIWGGKLAEELALRSLNDTLLQLSRAGRLHRIDDAKIDPIEKNLTQTGSCKSNDAHVVALCLASSCQLVFTKDQPLHSDLKAHSKKGKKISIYQNEAHSHLLTSCECI